MYGSNEPELEAAFAKNCQTSKVQLRIVEDLLSDVLPGHSRTRCVEIPESCADGIDEIIVMWSHSSVG